MIHPKWSRWNSRWMGIFHLNKYQITFGSYEDDKIFNIDITDVGRFNLTKSFPYVNIINQWTRVCFSFYFLKSKAQASVNGEVTTYLNFDHNIYDMYSNKHYKYYALSNTKFNHKLIFGRYFFGKNPFIGYMANINAWNRLMDAKELEERTKCDSKYYLDKGRGDVNIDRSKLS